MKHKTFVINLEKDAAKRQHMIDLCTRYGLDFEVVPAVYGAALSNAVMKKIYCEEKAIENPLVRRPLAKTEIGIAMSHISIYHRIVEEQLPAALVVEDDVFFDERLLALLSLVDQFPHDWQIVLIGHHSATSRQVDTATSFWRRHPLSDTMSLQRPSEPGYGAYGYLVNLKGAERLIDSLSVIEKPIDHYTGDDRHVNLYVCVPSLIRLHSKFSVSEETDRDRGKAQCRGEAILGSQGGRKHTMLVRTMQKLVSLALSDQGRTKIKDLWRFIRIPRAYRNG